MASCIVVDLSRGRPEGLPFQWLLHRGVGEGATPFPELFHLTLDPHPIMLSAKQGGIKYNCGVFGLTWSGIEPQYPRPLVNTLLIRPMVW